MMMDGKDEYLKDYKCLCFEDNSSNLACRIYNVYFCLF